MGEGPCWVLFSPRLLCRHCGVVKVVAEFLAGDGSKPKMRDVFRIPGALLYPHSVWQALWVCVQGAVQMLVSLWDLGNGTGHSVFRPKLTGVNATLPELAAVGRPDGPDEALGAILAAQPSNHSSSIQATSA